MDISQLLLKKEELPILHGNCFQVPIHPKLLNPSVNINPLIAKDVFPKVAKEWYTDLKEYLPLEKDPEKREWYENVFLKEKEVVIENNKQFFGIWEDEFQLSNNGFVICFSISRNAGGTLYFRKDDPNCQSFGQEYIKFSDDKRKEFGFKEGRCFVYASHNIDHYPGALFLRNWAIAYMNEVLQELF